MENNEFLELSYFLNSVLQLLQQADQIDDVAEDTKNALLKSAKEGSKALYEKLSNHFEAEMEKDEAREITFEELEEAAKPLVDLMRKKGHPLMAVLVTSRSADVLETVKGMPFPYDD